METLLYRLYLLLVNLFLSSSYMLLVDMYSCSQWGFFVELNKSGPRVVIERRSVKRRQPPLFVIPCTTIEYNVLIFYEVDEPAGEAIWAEAAGRAVKNVLSDRAIRRGKGPAAPKSMWGAANIPFR
jgi:hypothetical protein